MFENDSSLTFVNATAVPRRLQICRKKMKHLPFDGCGALKSVSGRDKYKYRSLPQRESVGDFFSRTCHAVAAHGTPNNAMQALISIKKTHHIVFNRYEAQNSCR